MSSVNLELSNIIASNIDINKSIVIDALVSKKYFANFVNNQPITIADIDFTIVNDSIDNTLGQVSNNVIIKNTKAWEECIIKETYISPNPILLSGFKERGKTDLSPTLNKNLFLDITVTTTNENEIKKLLKMKYYLIHLI